MPLTPSPPLTFADSIENRVYRDAGWVYLLLWHPEFRHDLRRGLIGDDVEIQVRRHTDRVGHVAVNTMAANARGFLSL
jgi:hypothetical protein